MAEVTKRSVLSSPSLAVEVAATSEAEVAAEDEAVEWLVTPSGAVFSSSESMSV